jgi:hypothetical protein
VERILGAVRLGRCMNYPNNPNELDWGSMSKAEFKHAELHYELRDEDARQNYIFVLYINDRRWDKEFYSVYSASKAADTIRQKYNKKVEIRKYIQ